MTGGARAPPPLWPEFRPAAGGARAGAAMDDGWRWMAMTTTRTRTNRMDDDDEDEDENEAADEEEPRTRVWTKRRRMSLAYAFITYTQHAYKKCIPLRCFGAEVVFYVVAVHDYLP